MTMTVPEHAPTAPGGLGEAIDQRALLDYLGGLGRWVDRQRGELDRLNTAALASDSSDSYTADIVLAESLWQAAKLRRAELERVWDSGRADAIARTTMSQLIWGRLDTGAVSTGAVSLVEAVRLLDALVAQLRTRLSFDPNAAGVAARITGVRAEVERCRDLVTSQRGPGLDPDALDRVNALRRRVDVLAERAGRGADVTGPLAQLEQDTARTERDLIVASSQSRELVRDIAMTRSRVEAADRREPALQALAERCRREILNPPRLAVPDISRLGPVPETRAELDLFLRRVEAVLRAHAAVEEAYSRPLRERAELRYRLEGYRAKARSTGRDRSATAAAGLAEAVEAVEAVPCDLDLARHYVEQYQFIVREPPRPGAAATTGQEGRSS